MLPGLFFCQLITSQNCVIEPCPDNVLALRAQSAWRALSEKLIVEVKREGKIWRQEYAYGNPTTEVQEIGSSSETGTTVTFYPDFAIMEKNEFNFESLSARLRELAFLNPGIAINIFDERTDKSHQFKFEGGIATFVKYLNENKDPLHDVISFSKVIDDIVVEIALQYTTSYTETVFSFVNNINTIEGGSHLNGFKTALTRAFNKYAKSTNVSDISL